MGLGGPGFTMDLPGYPQPFDELPGYNYGYEKIDQ